MPGWTRGVVALPPSSAIHVVDEGDYTLQFLRDSLTLRLLPAGRTALGTLSQPRVRIASDRPASPSRPPAEANAHADPRPTLDRLTLAVSNVCNLACPHCYAVGGTYYNTGGLMMSKETALRVFNQARRAYSRIGHVNFFGGEPTLNCDVIELLCEYIHFLFDRGLLSHLPTFGITTNAYVLTDRIVEMLTSYQFSVTVSLDGPREIHDRKRPMKDGRGTHDVVARNVKALIARGINVEFECTYTADHSRLGMDIVTLLDYFHDEFGCRTLHCPLASVPPGSPDFMPLSEGLTLLGDAIDASILNLVHGEPKAVSLAVRLLRSLTEAAPIVTYCPAGREEVTVNADGKVYACFMLMRSTAYSFGYTLPPTVVRDGRMRLPLPNGGEQGNKCQDVEALVSAADKYASLICGRCWAQPLCFGCIGEDWERSGGRDISRSSEPGVSVLCDYRRSLVERFLRAVGRATFLSQDPPGWAGRASSRRCGGAGAAKSFTEKV